MSDLCRKASRNKYSWANYITFAIDRRSTAKSGRCRDLPLQRASAKPELTSSRRKWYSNPLWITLAEIDETSARMLCRNSILTSAGLEMLGLWCFDVSE